MDITKEILKEHSKAQTDKIVRYVGNDATRFASLVDIFLKGPYRVTQRAGWPLSYCVEHHPSLLKPHLKEILGNLKNEGLHVAVKRNTVRMLQHVEVPSRYRGQVANICFDFLQNKKETVAVKAFSMSVLAAIAEKEPDLKKELRLIIEDMLPYSTPAIKSRARKILPQLL